MQLQHCIFSQASLNLVFLDWLLCISYFWEEGRRFSLLICVFCNKPGRLPFALCCFYSPLPPCGFSTKSVTASQINIVLSLILNNQCPVNGSFFLDLSSVYCTHEGRQAIRKRQINRVAVVKQAIHMPLGYLKVQTDRDSPESSPGRTTCI